MPNRICEVKVGSKDPSQVIKYAHASAVKQGQAVNIANMGPAIAHEAYDAAETGLYYLDGQWNGPIQTAITITAQEKLYYRPSTDTIVDDAGKTTADFFLGTAIAAGTAAGGRVDFELNRVDTSDVTA